MAMTTKTATTMPTSQVMTECQIHWPDALDKVFLECTQLSS